MTKRRVLELIPVLGSQLAGDVSHKPCGKNVKNVKKRWFLHLRFCCVGSTVTVLKTSQINTTLATSHNYNYRK